MIHQQTIDSVPRLSADAMVNNTPENSGVYEGVDPAQTPQPFPSPFTVALYDSVYRLIDEAWEYHRTEGVHPFGLYCSRTGRLLGTQSADSIAIIVRSYGETPPDNDRIILDSLHTTLCAARPSSAWLSQDRDSLGRLITADPVGAAVFFIARMLRPSTEGFKRLNPLAPGGKMAHTWATVDHKAHWNESLVRLFNHFDKQSLEHLHDLLMTLLQVDATMGLSNVFPPKGMSFQSLLALDSIPDNLIRTVQSHYTTIMTEYESRPIYRQTRDGNAHSAFTLNNFFRDIVRPKRPATPKEQAKASNAAQLKATFDSMWAEMSGGKVTASTPAPSTHGTPPAATVTKGAPRLVIRIRPVAAPAPASESEPS